jgi:hypothetical protein
LGRTLFAGHTVDHLRQALQRGETVAVGQYWGWRGIAGAVSARMQRWSRWQTAPAR